ncbi:hypothetical protein GDO81_022730 [Engystomops pustulosus]|uniref:Uncharacterized protein n=1 Tax=Engystomops pustulosus TaxID=76066 RepID=A0AAV6ZMT0_ENGPU|nr:hypothetical protein GDO81_022730 [Engystomops pustulosus]
MEGRNISSLITTPTNEENMTSLYNPTHKGIMGSRNMAPLITTPTNKGNMASLFNPTHHWRRNYGFLDSTSHQEVMGEGNMASIITLTIKASQKVEI